MSFPLLTATAALPAVGGGRRGRVPAERRTVAKQLALVVSLAVLVLTVVVAGRASTRPATASSSPSPTRGSRASGVRYGLGVDGIALVLIALTAMLVPLVILASWHDADRGDRRTRSAAGVDLLRAAAGAGGTMIGVFAATDVFLFYVFFEVMLIPMYFIIGSLRRGAAVRTRP